MPDERESTHLLCGRTHVRRPGSADVAIAGLAAEQHGVVARRQLVDLGVSSRSIDHRLGTSRLHRVFAGVYAVGHPRVSALGVTCAAVLASAPRTPRIPDRQNPAGRVSAAASHFSAAALAGLADAFPSDVHVTALERKRPQPGLASHRAALPKDEVRIVNGIPATGVPRTLLDLSAVLDARALRRLLKRAEFLSAVGYPELEEILKRYPFRKGRRVLAALVADGTAVSGRTRSDLEDEFLEFCRRRGLPRPETNQLLYLRGEQFEVDCVWRDQRLIAELDGWQAHGGRTAFEDDRARDRRLAAAGWTVVRVTWRQLGKGPLASELHSLLATHGERDSTHP